MYFIYAKDLPGPHLNIYTILTQLHLTVKTATLAEASSEGLVTLAPAGWDVKVAVLTAAHAAWVPWNLW